MKSAARMICLSLAALLAVGAASAWNPEPWLADLAQMRTEIDRHYPNRDWLTGQREVSLDKWFDRTADEVRKSHDDVEARRALDRLIQRFGDGHLTLQWPTAAAQSQTTVDAATSRSLGTTATFCVGRGYDAGQVQPGIAASIPGYRPIDAGGPFPAGVISIGATTVGVVRLGLFSPQGYPSVCKAAVASTRMAVRKPCNDECDDRLLTKAYALITRNLMTAVERLRVAGAEALLVDVTRNGGGTEWAEAAARIVFPVPLKSAPIGVIRSEAWMERWHSLAVKLSKLSTETPASDRSLLSDLSRRSQAMADNLRPCSTEACPRLAQSGFATGLLPESPAGQFDGKIWGPDVFSVAQFPYSDGVWNGGLIVLVDSETWSAAEQFAALLQDNRAAIVMGGRTGGAGCGHLYVDVPVVLHHSGARLEMPNCARFRRDGSNEVGGVIPDVPTGARGNDGLVFAGRLTANRLPEAVTKAMALAAERRPTNRAETSRTDTR